MSESYVLYNDILLQKTDNVKQVIRWVFCAASLHKNTHQFIEMTP
jgi:hypothetical protein